jgi:hypothetical protein
MRWVKYKPKQGDTREVIRFAWFPVEVQGFTVWFERYKIVQEFSYISRWGTGRCLEWITVSKDFYD